MRSSFPKIRAGVIAWHILSHNCLVFRNPSDPGGNLIQFDNASGGWKNNFYFGEVVVTEAQILVIIELLASCQGLTFEKIECKNGSMYQFY